MPLELPNSILPLKRSTHTYSIPALFPCISQSLTHVDYDETPHSHTILCDSFIISSLPHFLTSTFAFWFNNDDDLNVTGAIVDMSKAFLNAMQSHHYCYIQTGSVHWNLPYKRLVCNVSTEFVVYSAKFQQSHLVFLDVECHSMIYLAQNMQHLNLLQLSLVVTNSTSMIEPHFIIPILISHSRRNEVNEERQPSRILLMRKIQKRESSV